MQEKAKQQCGLLMGGENAVSASFLTCLGGRHEVKGRAETLEGHK